ncbi:MAG: hypothetical protein PWP27_2056 [Clostridiales bacterium]|jgi:molybdopterin converting factor small subunit|nr:hypothetical protein [Clostridiales bacterium]MDK2934246.1 hypothetical protein [Clostridiales bacterium]
MISITVNFYPPFSYYTKKKQAEVTLEDGTKFIDLLKQLVSSFPALKEMIPDLHDECIFYNNVFPVINNNLVTLQETLHDGDIINLFGSISGG